MIELENYSVGIYCRLSREDIKNGKKDVSLSIENQQATLEKYVNDRGWTIYKVYADDDFSGTTFDRPGWVELMRDVGDGDVNCIVVKDLSRFARNRIESALTREKFIEMGVRFLTVEGHRYDNLNDVDLDNGYDMATPMMEMVYEMHSADTSIKVRAVKKLMGQQGKFSNSQAPYGYAKSPNDKHKLIVDDESAAIVRGIYDSFICGASRRDIADKLNVRGVDSPVFYYYKKYKDGATPPARVRNKAGKPVLTEFKNVWGAETVRQILQNEVYIGNMVNGKRKNKSFKNKKRENKKPSEWLRVEGTHEAIVPIDVWERVQDKIKAKTRVYNTKRTKEPGLFAGVLKCADCGGQMAYMSGKKAYRCSRYNNNGGSKACTPHNLREYDITMYVLNDIKEYAVLSVKQRKSLEKHLMGLLNKSKNNDMKSVLSKISKAENRLSVLERLDNSLYENMVEGLITKDEFKIKKATYTKEKSEIEESLLSLRREHAAIEEATGEISEWIELIERCVNIETLERAEVLNLIDKIIVGETIKDEETKETYQDIEIHYRFIGNLLNAKEGAD